MSCPWEPSLTPGHINALMSVEEGFQNALNSNESPPAAKELAKDVLGAISELTSYCRRTSKLGRELENEAEGLRKENARLKQRLDTLEYIEECERDAASVAARRQGRER